jgi:cytidine deaminase
LLLDKEQKMNSQDKKLHALIEDALEVRLRAYAPYSNYQVGAALLTKEGKIYTGANVENAAYPTSICAERSAVFTAVSAGERKFERIVVATSNGGTPCGSCRQVLSEFGLDIEVILVNDQGEILKQTTVGDLLPGAFQGDDLE